MKNNKLMEIISSGNIVIPLYLYKQKDVLGLDTDEFLFLMYLYNKGDKVMFNPNAIGEDLGLDLVAVMKYVSSLSDKDIISVDVMANDKKVMEEYITLDNFYNKLSIAMINNNDFNNDVDDNDIFSFMESEFGRTLSPTEYEVIKAWLDDTSEELIQEAVKEAVLNGVSNLRYIDKILYEWKKRGIKNKDDVIKNKKKNRDDKSTNIDVFEYDWLDDNED